MSQYDFETIDPATKSGTALATDLNSWRTALHSCHKGSSRPSYAVAGTLWIDDVSTPWDVKMYDGTDDISIGTVNATTNTFTPSGALVSSDIDSTVQAYSATLAGIAAGTTATGSFKNKIINGRFQINQRVYASSAVLAAGSYGHDRWKAGASGGDYTFTQNAADTTITIASGKSLIQVVEAGNVSDSSWVLSWTGTAQARYGVNSATPSGAYAASPVLITGQTVGTVMSIEFDDGTLGDVQLEPGSVATAFEARSVCQELALCQRYYYRYQSSANSLIIGSAYNDSTTVARGVLKFPVSMRAAPVSLEQSGTAANYAVIASGGGGNCSSVPVFYSASTETGAVAFTTSGLTAGQGSLLVSGSATGASAYLGFPAEL